MIQNIFINSNTHLIHNSNNFADVLNYSYHSLSRQNLAILHFILAFWILLDINLNCDKLLYSYVRIILVNLGTYFLVHVFIYYYVIITIQIIYQLFKCIQHLSSFFLLDYDKDNSFGSRYIFISSTVAPQYVFSFFFLRDGIFMNVRRPEERAKGSV